MEYSDIELWDWHRIFIGDAPVIYLVEVFLRTLLSFVILLVTLKLMGKRMGGQITLTEMAVMITLGALISVPMQIYDRGILLGIIALLVALAFQRGYNYLGVKNEKFENISQGELSLLIKDGEFELDQMKKSSISQNQLKSVLRNEKIYNLNQVSRLYLEACGIFSLYENHKAVLDDNKWIFPEKTDLVNDYKEVVLVNKDNSKK